MTKTNRRQESITIGMDLGDKNSYSCLLGISAGKRIAALVEAVQRRGWERAR